MQNKCLVFYGDNYEDLDDKQLQKDMKFSNSLSGIVYTQKLVGGLKNLYPSTHGLLTYPIAWWPKYTNKIWIRQRGKKGSNFLLDYCNIVGLKNFSLQHSYIQAEKKFLKTKPGLSFSGIDILVIGAESSSIRGAAFLKKRTVNTKVVLVIPDLPILMNTSGGKIYRFLKGFESRKLMRLAKKYVDGYVFLTDYMRPAVGDNEKPYIISEGIADSIEPFNEKIDDPLLVYTGVTSEYYSNISSLIESFINLRKKNPSLHLIIAGSGDNNKELEASAKINGFTFLGPVSPNEASILQKKASVLINLRLDSEIFKFSFPSKTMSYLSTGKPVVSFLLRSMPNEYGQILFIPRSPKISDISEAIERALNLKKDERRALWEKTKEFLVSKSQSTTGMKIYQLFDQTRER